jgi:uncharacterized protein
MGTSITRLIGEKQEPFGGRHRWCTSRGRPSADAEPERTVLVIGELDEGPWWWSQLVDADPAGLTAGQRLRIEFRRTGDEHEAVPAFVLAKRRAGSGFRRAAIA